MKKTFINAFLLWCVFLLIMFGTSKCVAQACPAQPLNYPCDAFGNPTYTNYDEANVEIQQDTINAILRRLIKQAALSVTACPALPLNYPCDASGNPTWTSYDLANVWIQQDTTIVLLRKLLAGGGGGIVVSIKDSAWLLTGNTLLPGQFLGSNNPANIFIKRDDTTVACISNNNNRAFPNVALGMGAINNYNATSLYNTNGDVAIGVSPLGNITTGNFDVAIGYQPMINATTASNCTVIGFNTGLSIELGNYNAVFGNGDFGSTTSLNGTHNVVIGNNALTHPGANTSHNTIVSDSGFTKITGNNNGGICSHCALNGTSYTNAWIASGYGTSLRGSNTLNITDSNNIASYNTGQLHLTNSTANSAALDIQSSSNSDNTIGTATLVGGTVTVLSTAVKANSIIFLTEVNPAGTTGTGNLVITTITANTSFMITSSSVIDISTVNWIIINQP